MASKSIHRLVLAGLISFPVSLSAQGVEEGLQYLGAGIGIAFCCYMYEEMKKEFEAKEPKEPSNFIDDCNKVAKTCAVVPIVFALTKGKQAGCEALTTSVIGGAAYIATNRLVQRHDLPFWPMAIYVALYSLSKGVCKQLNLPVLDWQ